MKINSKGLINIVMIKKTRDAILKISKKIKRNFLFTLSIIKPANKARKTPGAVDVAIMIPRDNSEFVFSRTNQLIAIMFIPKPIRDIILPIKNIRKVLFLRILNNFISS
tara:strand:- start:257 stop:583 length:327 start_codon:yes stop_codon:yes gene_type:complete